MAGLVDDRTYVNVNVDSEGQCITGIAGLSHPAVRGPPEHESAFKPRTGDVAPRRTAWKAGASNTQKPHPAP